MPFNASGSTLNFYMYSRSPTNNASDIERVTYTASGGLRRNGVQLLGSDTFDSFSVTPLYTGPSDPSVLPDLVEVNLEMSSSRDYSEVRVYVEGRGHDQSGISPTDVIDTSSGN
jgi:hypothetical protein